MMISKKDARRWIIQSGGLNVKRPFGQGKQSVYRAIDHLGYVQIDTISVVERAHHHVISSRVPDYQKQWLYDLQQEAKVLEYWSHAAAYLPMNDFRYTLPLKRFFAEARDGWPKSDKELMKKVFDRVAKEGPLMARDFHSDEKRKGEGWWDWKPAKLALERLFFQGSLVTIGRQGFQKIYDLPENYLPNHIDTSYPSEEEQAEYLIDRAVKLHGIVSLPEIVYLRKKGHHAVKKVLEKKITEKSLCRVSISGLEGQQYFVSANLPDQPLRISSQVKILSPFDNITIQRKRLKNFFDFDYQIECYVPAAKRIYGYFCLPILYRDQFVGRMDAKTDRVHKKLIIKNIHFENDYAKVDPDLYKVAFRDFAMFNGCQDIILEESSHRSFSDQILR